MKEFLLNLMSASLEQFGESKVEQLLQRLHDENPVLYDVAVHAGLVFANALRPLSDKTQTHIDDAILDGIVASIEASAAANGFVINDVDDKADGREESGNQAEG